MKRPVLRSKLAAASSLAAMVALATAFARVPSDDYYLTEFCDYRSADGQFRKYRFIFVDRAVYPYHLAIGPHWKLHYWRVDMEAGPDLKREWVFVCQPARQSRLER